MMIATEETKINPKHRASRARYFQNYRKRAKLRGRVRVATKTLGVSLKFKQSPFLLFLTVLNTGYLIFVSTQILPGQFYEKLIVAMLTEFLLIALVVFKPHGFLERIVRSVLLLGFMAYAVAPYLTEPFKKVESLKIQQSLIGERVASLRAQVAQQSKLYDELVARERITRAQQVAIDLQHSQELLRNHLLELATSAEVIGTTTLIPAWVLALQRLLFVLVNMLLVHRVAHGCATVPVRDEKEFLPNKANLRLA